MNAGTDIGFPFMGPAPEPGAVESTLSTATNIDLPFQMEGPPFYPHPVKEILHLAQNWDVQSLFLIDISGKRHTLEMTNHSIDISHLPNGVYILTIITKRDQAYSEKNTIQK